MNVPSFKLDELLMSLRIAIQPAMDQHPIQGELEILLVALCYKNRDKLRPYQLLA